MFKRHKHMENAFIKHGQLLDLLNTLIIKSLMHSNI